MLGSGALLQQELGLAAILEDHAVTDKPVTDAYHHGNLVELFAQLHDGGQHVESGVLPAHDFQQAHDVGRAEKVQAHHILRP